jgi:hypothetical protein
MYNVYPSQKSLKSRCCPSCRTCVPQVRFDIPLTSLVSDPKSATIRSLVQEAAAYTGSTEGFKASSNVSLWLSPTPTSVKLRLFCLPYAGGVSENVFARCAFHHDEP